MCDNIEAECYGGGWVPNYMKGPNLYQFLYLFLSFKKWFSEQRFSSNDEIIPTVDGHFGPWCKFICCCLYRETFRAMDRMYFPKWRLRWKIKQSLYKNMFFLWHSRNFTNNPLHPNFRSNTRFSYNQVKSLEQIFFNPFEHFLLNKSLHFLKFQRCFILALSTLYVPLSTSSRCISTTVVLSPFWL